MSDPLSIFKPSVVTVNIKTNYGKAVAFGLRLPSYHRYREIISSVPEPKLPMRLDKPGGTKIPDRESPAYNAALRERAEEQNCRLLVDALVSIEGEAITFPGDDIAEKTASFRASDPDAGLVNALSAFIVEAATGVRATPDDAPFRPVRETGNASLSDAGDHA